MPRIVQCVLLMNMALMASAAANPDTVSGRMLTKPGTVIEAEALASRAKASAGTATAQDMRGFGTQWSGGAQLLWRPPAPVDTPIRNWPNLTLPIDVPADGQYNVTLQFTAAPDYGIARVFLRGEAVGDFHGYSPQVALKSMDLGQRKLTAGSNQLVLTVFGKDATSSNYFVGVDRISVRPAASAPAATRTTGGASVVATQLSALPLPPPMAVQQKTQLLSAAGASGGAIDAATVLSPYAPVKPGVGRLAFVGWANFAPPDMFYVFQDKDSYLSVIVDTVPDQFFLVNFVVRTSSGGALLGESTYAHVRFDTTAEANGGTFAAQTSYVTADQDWQDVPVAFKAPGGPVKVSIRRGKPGTIGLGRVEVSAMK